MTIDNSEIEHIAELARLHLSEAEKNSFSQQLADILDYVGQLNEVDTKDVIETAQVSGLTNVWRDDEAQDWSREEVDNALHQGKLENNQLKVKRVL